MPTQASPSRSSASKSGSTGGGANDAIDLLMADHAKVRSLFAEFEELGPRAVASKRKIARAICTELSKHTLAEEEVFYPAVRATGKENAALVDVSLVEHASVTALVEQIAEMEPSDDLFEARLKVLAEQVEHHVEEEENTMFPKVRELDLDLESLGEEIQARKEEADLPPVQ